jgi:nicotinamidase-related amidase
MAYCPECGAEFPMGMRRCPECLVDLVEELEDPNVDEVEEDNLVLIQSTHSAEEAKKVTDLMQRHGILCVTESDGRPKSNPPHGLKVLVNRKDEARAQDLIKGHLG